MTLDDWIESLFPFSFETDWDAIISEPSSPFSAESSSKLKVFLEECFSNSEISDYFEKLLPILISSFSLGIPCVLLTINPPKVSYSSLTGKFNLYFSII